MRHRSVRQPETIARAVRLRVHAVANDANHARMYSRVQTLTDPHGMVGFSFQAIEDAFYGQYTADRLLTLTYETRGGIPVV